MKYVFFLIALATLSVIVTGCGKEAAQTKRSETGTQAASEGEGHLAANVVPGSYENWCEEHGVPETACTRCDASLIPAFKAVGDWDEEHGLPKSQCLKCNPSLKIVRPPKPEGK